MKYQKLNIVIIKKIYLQRISTFFNLGHFTANRFLIKFWYTFQICGYYHWVHVYGDRWDWALDFSLNVLFPWRKMEQPYSPNLSDLAECVILCTSWLPPPGKVYCRMVNIWVTLVELRGPILSAQEGSSSPFTVLKSCSAEILHTWHQWTQRTKYKRQWWDA